MEKGKVLGIGGIFFKAREPKKLCAWYQNCLGLKVEADFDGGTFQLDTLPDEAYSIWSAFPADTNYFKGSKKDYMINFVVDDVSAVLARVKEAGGHVAGGPESSEYGDFGWVIDPEGNKIELWKPR